MDTIIIYPIILDLKIKRKSSTCKRMLIVEHDRIKYYESKNLKNKKFESPIEDCQIFEKNKESKSNYELHLISISK